MIRRLIFVIMIFSLIFSSFSACNDESLPSETEEMTETPSESEAATDNSPEGIIEQLYSNATVISSTKNCKEAVLVGVQKDALLSRFSESGFAKLETNTVEGANFETILLTNDTYEVTVYTAKHSTELRVMWEPIGSVGKEILLPNTNTGAGSATVAQIGTERVSETDNPLVGMCYIIKLSDGKAIIIDGGFNNDACADNLYNSLATMGVAKADGKYAIEAWIVTHDHIDHSGTYKNFSQKYADSVTLKYVISAFPGSSKIVSSGGSAFLPWGFKEAKLINPHAGLKYYFGNAVISMLYTPDMLYDPSAKIAYYNDTSLVFKVEAGGSEVLFFGDAGNMVAQKLLRSYDDATFKSDIFQMTHHGLMTDQSDGLAWMNTKKLYDAIGAHTVLLPMQSRYDALGRNGRYTVLIEWSRVDFQISYVTDKSDDHGLDTITQDYFNEFTASVEDGTNEKETLYGYNGINKLVNSDGLVTYLGANETEPMVTLFELSDGNAVLTLNEMLYDWLSAAQNP